MTHSDAEILARCRKNDREAYRILVMRYQRPLLAFIRGRSWRGAEAAEEAAQETFVRAYLQLGSLARDEAFFSWLLGIADRVVKESRRNAARERLAFERLAQVRQAALRVVEDPEIPDVELESAIAGLAAPYRQVVLLRYYGGLSCGEVGERLGMPLGSVTKVLSRAYAMLRETLETMGGVSAMGERSGAVRSAEAQGGIHEL